MVLLHENEKILKKVRRHGIILAVEILFFVVLALLPIIGAWFFLQSKYITLVAPVEWSNETFYSIMIFFYLSWLLLLWILFFINWTNYYLDVLIVTNERVIDIEQIGLFARDIAEVSLHNIEDMHVKVVGVIPTLLNFGNLTLQTAGTSREFIIKSIPKPLEVKDIILQVQYKLNSKSQIPNNK